MLVMGWYAKLNVISCLALQINVGNGWYVKLCSLFLDNFSYLAF